MERIIIFCALLISCRAALLRNTTVRYFPDEFVFGASTSAFQIEGAWNEDGKTDNIWDYYIRMDPSVVADGSNAEVACNSYHLYKEDVRIIRELGLDIYRMSISWPRLLPSGFANEINEPAVEFYNNYINELVDNGITVVVTLYHWDLPQSLQNLGGVANPLFVDWFEDYARVAYTLFGDRVKMWVTFNEPKQFCYEGYGVDIRAPAVNGHGIAEYMCTKNVIMANARAYHLYDNEFRETQGGQVGYVTEVAWYSSETDSEEDQFAAELKREADWAIYSDPIFSPAGGWPELLSQRIAEKSAAQGYPRSRLPEFTEEEKEYVRGTADFYGINHYSSHRVSATNNLLNNPVPSLLDDIDVGLVRPADWPTTEFGTMPRGPDSIFNLLQQVHERYPDTDFYIMESGTATRRNTEDDVRVQTIRDCLDSALNALDAGIPLKGYMVWSLMDNFSWNNGLTRRLGLYDLDFEDDARPRTPKKSAFAYKHIIQNRYIDYDYEPVDRNMTIDPNYSRRGNH